jgi:hypothetical protein
MFIKKDVIFLYKKSRSPDFSAFLGISDRWCLATNPKDHISVRPFPHVVDRANTASTYQMYEKVALTGPVNDKGGQR